nr:MAG TPA: hypothetical protein [Bacteriophage sp.]
MESVFSFSLMVSIGGLRFYFLIEQALFCFVLRHSDPLYGVLRRIFPRGFPLYDVVIRAICIGPVHPQHGVLIDGAMRVGSGSRPVVILQRAKLFHLRIPLVRGDAEHSGFQFAVNGDIAAGRVSPLIHNFLLALVKLVEHWLLVAQEASHRASTSRNATASLGNCLANQSTISSSCAQAEFSARPLS